MAAGPGAGAMCLLLKLFPCHNFCTSSQRFITRRLKCVKKCASHSISTSKAVIYPTEAKTSDGKSGFVKYDALIRSRRREAARSLVVQIQSKQSCRQLYDYCTSLAPVQSLFYYYLNDNNHFALVEFHDEVGREEVMHGGCTHGGGGEVLPVVSPMVWLRGASGGRDKRGSSKACLSQISTCDANNLPLVDAIPTPSQQDVINRLYQIPLLSDQIISLFNWSKLDEVGIRLRYMTAHQLERCLLGLFPNCKALPFGSSVNGFGGGGCDLDIVLVYDDEQASNNSRLVFQSKGCGGGGSRSQVQRQMELMGDLVHLYLPGCSSVKRILQARVPIVKYTQELTGVDCDLSLTNMCAVYMSELLYLFGELDSRVRPLVFAVKRWAQVCGLTAITPGRWITNFSLALLVLFYLQRIKVLPSLDDLIKVARPEDVRFVDDVNCTYLRDITMIQKGGSGTSRSFDSKEKSLAQLLCGFFEFYTKFDFATTGISVCSGGVIIKPDYSALYIVNPLERSLNVSKNVSPEEVERLRVEVRNALWCLEGEGNLPELFLNGGTASAPIHNHHYQRALKSHSRLVAVKDLFTEHS